MDLENQAADSASDQGYAGGETRIESSAPQAAPEKALSLRDSLTKAAAKVTERTQEASPAREDKSGQTNAFEPAKKTQPNSLPLQAGSQESPASDILEAPKHWNQKWRDAFGRFTGQPDAQREWLNHAKEMETEFQRKAQEHAEIRKFADTVRESFAPEQRALLQQTGKTELEAVKWLAQVDQYARQDPKGYALWFMRETGLTPQQLFPELGQGAPQQGQEAEWVDPEVIKLREELGSLRSQQQQYQAWIQQQEAAKRAETQTVVSRTIQQFSEAKDEAGNPLYPHFSEVENRMAWELQNNPELQAMPVGVEKLKAAYDIAVWANPTTRQAMLDAKLNAEQAEAAKRQAADRARAAQTLKPKVASVAGASQVPPTDLRSLIKDAASRARG